MPTHDSETADGEREDDRSATKHARSWLARRRRDGSLATLAGATLLAWAAKRVRTSKAKAALGALTGVALLGVGRQQRRAKRAEDRVETGADAERTDTGEKATDDEAHAEATQDLGAGRNADESASVDQSASEPNPRGTTDRDDVEGDDGGDVDFVEGREPGEHQEAHLEDEHDTRLGADEEDESVEIDLSESAMADETSEAAGPQPEQAYPAQEGTDPEPTAPNAPERVIEDDESDEPSDAATEEESGTGSDDAEEHV
jgi:hypothetical protein